MGLRGMKVITVLVIVVSIFTLSTTIGIQTSFGQSISNYELDKEVKASKERIGGSGIPDGLSFSGAVEVEYGFENGYGDEKTSDITLATVELGVEARISDWAVTDVVLLWEEDDTPQVEVDKGTITLGNTERSPF